MASWWSSAGTTAEKPKPRAVATPKSDRSISKRIRARQALAGQRVESSLVRRRENKENRYLDARTTGRRSVCHYLSELWVVAARARGGAPDQPDHPARKVGLEARKVRRSPPVGARKKLPTKCIPLYCASQKVEQPLRRLRADAVASALSSI